MHAWILFPVVTSGPTVGLQILNTSGSTVA